MKERWRALPNCCRFGALSDGGSGVMLRGAGTGYRIIRTCLGRHRRSRGCRGRFARHQTVPRSVVWLLRHRQARLLERVKRDGSRGGIVRGSALYSEA